MRIGFIGAGRVAAALALGMRRREYGVVSIADIVPERAAALAGGIEGCTAFATAAEAADAAELVFITTPDDAIAAVDGEVPWCAGQRAVHCSGALPCSILRNASSRGALVGGLHPLQTFPGGPQDVERLSGITFAVETEDEELRAVLEEIAIGLGGEPLRISGRDKLLYHAAAVIAGNYSLALMEAASNLWQAIGLDPEEACRRLSPLVHGSIDNASRSGIEASLTGPIARGDAETVAKQIEAIGGKCPELLKLYAVCGKLILSTARRHLDDETSALLAKLLDDAEGNKR